MGLCVRGIYRPWDHTNSGQSDLLVRFLNPDGSLEFRLLDILQFPFPFSASLISFAVSGVQCYFLLRLDGRLFTELVQRPRGGYCF